MQKNSVADVLRALATGDKARSETARLRDVVDEVEAALSAGVSRAAILEALHGQGFTMTLKSFESALYRIRKQREKAGQHPAPAPLPTAAPAQNLDVSKSGPVAAPVEPEPAPPVSDETSPGDDDLSGLDKRQRREKLADQYIKPETTNPLLKRLKKEQSK